MTLEQSITIDCVRFGTELGLYAMVLLAFTLHIFAEFVAAMVNGWWLQNSIFKRFFWNTTYCSYILFGGISVHFGNVDWLYNCLVSDRYRVRLHRCRRTRAILIADSDDKSPTAMNVVVCSPSMPVSNRCVLYCRGRYAQMFVKYLLKLLSAFSIWYHVWLFLPFLRKARNYRRLRFSNIPPTLYNNYRASAHAILITMKLVGRSPRSRVSFILGLPGILCIKQRILVDDCAEFDQQRSMIDSLQMALERERTARIFLEQQLNQMREMYQNGLKAAVTPTSASPPQQRQQQPQQQQQQAAVANSAPKITATTTTMSVHDSVIRPTPLIAPISGELTNKGVGWALDISIKLFQHFFFFYNSRTTHTVLLCLCGSFH